MIIWGKGMMFTDGIPILVSSGLFSLGGRMMRVAGEREPLGQYLLIFVIGWHGLASAVRRTRWACPEFHLSSHFRVNTGICMMHGV